MPVVAKPPPPVVEAPAPVPESSVGALERPSALRHFFEGLARIEAGEALEDVRITQFGDSHTEADYETATVRRALQERFRNGGRGFVAIGKPWPKWSQEGVLAGMSAGWSPAMGGLGTVGLGGAAIVTRQGGAAAWAHILTPTSRAELDYLEQPTGGGFDVLVDGVRVVRIATRSERTQPAFRAFDVPETPTPHQIEVRTVGDGEVRLFGMALDRVAEHGVVVDAFGINGARITTLLSWNEQHWGEQLKHRSPTLVVLAYGTNDADTTVPMETFERELGEALGRLSRAVPEASCLVLGPPDRASKSGAVWKTTPRILEVIASERRAAEAARCAFYDRQGAMGGEGTIAHWAATGAWAQADRVHLTRAGYTQVGTTFVTDLMTAYDAWKRASKPL